MNIKRIETFDDSIGEFINEEFSQYGEKSGLALNYDDFCFVAENKDGQITGVITGHAYYNEVHISNLIIKAGCRRNGLGKKLVETVEETYSGKEYEKITVSTYGFQAPEFYQKLGYTVEFIRDDKEPKLRKYFLSKPI